MGLREKIEKEAPDLCKKFEISRLGVFGSVARDEENEDSDIDFFAEFESPSPESMPDRYFGFIEAAASLFDRSVQLITPRMMRNPHFIRSVEPDLKIIHE